MAKRPFGESDAMVDLLTLTRGLETYVAKGAFRSRRRLVGGLEPFTRAEFTVYQSRPGKLPMMQDLKVLVTRFELYRDLDVFTRLTDVSMFLVQNLPPGVPEYETCELFDALLCAVSAGGRCESLVLSFYLRVFGAMGWRLDVGACARCKQLPASPGEYEIDFPDGKMFCPACAAQSATANSERARLTLEQARCLSHLILPPRLKPGIAIDAAAEADIRKLIDRYLLWHTGSDLPGRPLASRTV